MSVGKGDTPRPFSWAKWDASKLWKKPNMNDINTISQSGDLLRNIDVGEMLRLRERNAELERELAVERKLADRLAGEIESWASIAGDYTPMSADKAIAAWKEARNPAQTTGEGAE